MIYTIFDLETSGLNAGTDDVLQFAYMLLDSDTNQCLRANSFYLWEDDFRWTFDAYNVHGISKEFLKALPKERMPEKYQEMFTVLSRANLAGYNVAKFDRPFVDAFLANRSVKPLPYDSITDVMALAQKATGKRKKLTELTRELGHTPESVQAINNLWFGTTGQAHDASYDVTATALCLVELRRLGYA